MWWLRRPRIEAVILPVNKPSIDVKSSIKRAKAFLPSYRRLWRLDFPPSIAPLNERCSAVQLANDSTGFFLSRLWWLRRLYFPSGVLAILEIDFGSHHRPQKMPMPFVPADADAEAGQTEFPNRQLVE